MNGTMAVVWVLTDKDEREMKHTNAQRAHHVQLIHHSILKVSDTIPNCFDQVCIH